MEGLSQLPNKSQADAQEAEQQRAQEEQLRRDVMATVLEPAARERLSRISLVSPERSRQIEMMLVRMAQSGQLRGKVTENQLIDLLDQMENAQGKGAQSSKPTTIVYQRRKDLDDDFDLDF